MTTLNLLVAFVALLLALLLLVNTLTAFNIKNLSNGSEMAQTARYEQAVRTPKSKKPSMTVRKPQPQEDLIDLSQLNFDEGYDAVAAYGRGES